LVVIEQPQPVAGSKQFFQLWASQPGFESQHLAVVGPFAADVQRAVVLSSFEQWLPRTEPVFVS
jgi:hypothetical protein